MHGTQLIAQHEKMVHGLASRLRRELSLRGELDDLIAFGFGGLLEAQRRFDPGRGVRFRTFAYYRVRGAMLDGRPAPEGPRALPSRGRSHAHGSADRPRGGVYTYGHWAEYRDGASRQLRLRDPRGRAPQERERVPALAGLTEVVAEAAGLGPWLLLRGALHRFDGPRARYLQILGKSNSSERTARPSRRARFILKQSRPVSRNPGLPGRLRAHACTRLLLKCELQCALGPGCELF